MYKKSLKLELPRTTVEVSVDIDRKYTLWMHNKSIDEHLSIVLRQAEYDDLCRLLERIRHDG